MSPRQIVPTSGTPLDGHALCRELGRCALCSVHSSDRPPAAYIRFAVHARAHQQPRPGSSRMHACTHATLGSNRRVAGGTPPQVPAIAVTVGTSQGAALLCSFRALGHAPWLVDSSRMGVQVVLIYSRNYPPATAP